MQTQVRSNWNQMGQRLQLITNSLLVASEELLVQKHNSDQSLGLECSLRLWHPHWGCESCDFMLPHPAVTIWQSYNDVLPLYHSSIFRTPIAVSARAPMQPKHMASTQGQNRSGACTLVAIRVHMVRLRVVQHKGMRHICCRDPAH